MLLDQYCPFRRNVTFLFDDMSVLKKCLSTNCRGPDFVQGNLIECRRHEGWDELKRGYGASHRRTVFFFFFFFFNFESLYVRFNNALQNDWNLSTDSSRFSQKRYSLTREKPIPEGVWQSLLLALSLGSTSKTHVFEKIKFEYTLRI